jgi:hypothetical protein
MHLASACVLNAYLSALQQQSNRTRCPVKVSKRNTEVRAGSCHGRPHACTAILWLARIMDAAILCMLERVHHATSSMIMSAARPRGAMTRSLTTEQDVLSKVAQDCWHQHISVGRPSFWHTQGLCSCLSWLSRAQSAMFRASVLRCQAQGRTQPCPCPCTGSPPP